MLLWEMLAVGGPVGEASGRQSTVPCKRVVAVSGPVGEGGSQRSRGRGLQSAVL